MRHKNPELMLSIKEYIHEYFASHFTTPSTTEIADLFGIARSTAFNYLVAMDKAGMISYRDGIITDEELELFVKDRENVPIVGQVPCGEPAEELENIECMVSLPTAIFGKGPYYLLHATGDSMVDEGIEEGDLLLIKMQKQPNVGDIIVALDQNNQNTLKRYGGKDRKTGMYRLEYCNERVYPDEVILVKRMSCQGVLSHVIKAK